MSDNLEIVEKDITIKDAVSISCHVATAKSGYSILKAPYICNIKTHIDTLEGKKNYFYQLLEVHTLNIWKDVKHSSGINRFKDWIDIEYFFSDPYPVCRIHLKDISCKMEK